MNRLGFHYFPDTQHFRQHDLKIWLPRLQSMGARWLVLSTPTKRAIPEHFIRPLIEAEIQPLLHFRIQQSQLPSIDDLQLLLDTYHRWGVRYVTIFDQPNTHKVWLSSNWAQAELVERFLDQYLPFAQACLNASLIPIFPPLKPGGDFWDTAFLRRSLQSLRRRGQDNLLEQMVIGAYSHPGEKPLQWGAGGPERWPNARPYYTPPGVEDHRGFRIFDWYSAISQAVLSTTIPIFLFGMGYTAEMEDFENQNLIITRLLEGEFIEGYETLPEEVLGGAFNHLISPDTAPKQGWFDVNGKPRAPAKTLLNLTKKDRNGKILPDARKPVIRHYLLLPSFEWGISDYHLDIIRPLVKKWQPTIGFSIEEAQNAQRVTVLGGEEKFSEESLNQLRTGGILVERLNEDGTDIASVLATLS